MKSQYEIGPGTQWLLLVGAAVVAVFLMATGLPRVRHPSSQAGPITTAGQSTQTHPEKSGDATLNPGVNPKPETGPAVLPPAKAGPAAAPENGLDLAGIASTNAALALSLFQAVAGNDTNRYASLTNLLLICARSDPHAVVAWAGAMLALTNGTEMFGPEQLASATIDALLQTTNSDLARSAVEQWCQNTNRPQIGNGVFETLALEMADSSPTNAAGWLKSLPPATDRNYAMTTLAANWAGGNPSAAMDWALGLSDADGRASVLERGFREWAEGDPDAATKWLTGHISDPAAEQMVVSLAVESDVAYVNPQDAIVWAGLISDPTVRLESTQDIFLGWVRREPDAAMEYIQKDPYLTATEKQEVLKSYFGWKNSGGN